MDKKGRAKLSDADLRAGCREIIEKSIGLPSSEIEAAARERNEAYKDEEKLDREVPERLLRPSRTEELRRWAQRKRRALVRKLWTHE